MEGNRGSGGNKQGFASGPSQRSGRHEVNMQASCSTSRSTPGQVQTVPNQQPRMMITGGIPGFNVYTVNGVEVAVCPFKKEHVVKLSRIQYHIAKCMKTHKEGKLRCPYNATEWVNLEDYDDHLKVCKSREAEKVHFSQSAQQEVGSVQHTAPPLFHADPEGDESDW